MGSYLKSGIAQSPEFPFDTSLGEIELARVSSLGLYSQDKGAWNLRALQWLRIRLDAELATTGAPEFENLQAIMAEGGFGERMEKGKK